jgi:N-acetylated-alpha-linked acidic dipeptidase
MRLASAAVLPFEFTNFAETVGRYVDEIAKLPQPGGGATVDLAPLRASVERLRRSADGYDRALLSLAHTGTFAGEHLPGLKALNEMLFHSERRLTSEAGLPRREWYKHQIYAPGYYTGYGVKTLPGVREAIEQENWAEASAQVQVVSKTLDAMSAQIEAASKRLRGR